VQKLLQSETFASSPSDSATLKSYDEKCSKLFPLATTFRPPPSSTEATPSNAINVKETVPKNISANEEGDLVLKETALSLAAMSDLSGDINDAAAANPSVTTTVSTGAQEVSK
jgi:hypothetical protein